jgi:hypothetical protein
MHDDEWQRTFMFRANVNEVNFEPIDLGDELKRLEFRVEVFNILNTAIWAAMPARVFLTPSSFGNIQNTFGRTESFGTARQVQLAVRYSF